MQRNPFIYYLPIAGLRKKWVHAFSKSINAKWNPNNNIQVLILLADSIFCNDNHFSNPASGVWHKTTSGREAPVQKI